MLDGSELLSNERQVAPDTSGIRRDHVARYEWAAQRIGAEAAVVDLGCGVGYGSVILAQAAATVTGIDRSADALSYAALHYRPWQSIGYVKADLCEAALNLVAASIAVAFEIIEHLSDPRPMLIGAAERCQTLYASVPNEEVFPFTGQAFHRRHYTALQFEQLLGECGWHVDEWWGQQGPHSEVERDLTGRTLIVKARRAAAVRSLPAPARSWTAPRHVAIVGLGPSAEAYMDVVKRLGSRHAFADQTWAVNSLGSVLQCDLAFHMDDVRIQEIRAAARPASNIANMLAWLRTAPGPVMTSIAHPDYPGLIEFPLEAVVNKLGRGYFNNTAAYAVAFAIYLGVEKISIFGCDYTYPDAHKAERGRACLEFWLGYAAHAGIELAMPGATTLLDSYDDRGEEDIAAYGYDCVKIGCDALADGTVRLRFSPRGELPTADEIEAAYDHSRRPVDQRR